MDTSLWSAYNLQCVLHPLWGEISHLPVLDPITKKLITGPLIEKTYDGPSRLSKEAESIGFREKYVAKGVHITLSLPNGTECTDKLDQMYSTFKPATNKITKRVAAMKMVDFVEARKNTYSHEKQSRKSFVHDLEVYLDEQEGSGDHYNLDDDLQDKDEDCAVTLKVGRSICSVVLTYRDISHIVNGFPGDPIHLRPFDNCFSKVNIKRTWIAVVFLLMTRN